MIAFPRDEIENAIRDEIRCANDDRPVPRGQWEPEVDSYVMVRVVLRVEEEIGLKLPDDCMPPGGVDSIDRWVETMTSACERIWLQPSKTQGAKVS